jgi:hypothetical protein
MTVLWKHKKFHQLLRVKLMGCVTNLLTTWIQSYAHTGPDQPDIHRRVSEEQENNDLVDSPPHTVTPHTTAPPTDTPHLRAHPLTHLTLEPTHSHTSSSPPTVKPYLTAQPLHTSSDSYHRSINFHMKTIRYV